MNNYDDDNDGNVDCEDADCFGQVFSPDGRVCLYGGSGSEQGSANCSDGYDNDGDSYIDCYDSDCSDECGINTVSGTGITHSPENTSFSLTGDVTISGTATTIIRKGGDLYVSYSYSGGDLGGITIVLGSYSTGEVIDTNVFDVSNAEFVSNPDSFSIDKTYASDGYLTFSSSGISSFYFQIRIPGKGVLDESSTIKSTAEIGTNTASGSFNTEVVNNQSPSIDVLEIEPSTGKLTVQDKIQVIAGNFTGYSGGQSNSGGEGRCRIQITGPNGFSIDEYRNDCKSSNNNNYKVTSSGTYSVSITPYDNTGNAGAIKSDSISLSIAPKITFGIGRADIKRVFMASSNDEFDSFEDEYNSYSGTMLATFETDANNAFTSNSCTATIWDESGNFVSSNYVTADLRNNGQEVVCVVDSDLSGISSDGLYRVTVNATDSQSYSLKTSELVFFNCNDLTSAGDTWNCSLADFDVDGYTEGIYLPFRYDDGTGTLTSFACDSCPGATNLGKDADGDGFDNVCDPICGDGYVEGNEECDDGNTENGDGCSSNCRLEEDEEDEDEGGGGGAAEEEEEEEEIIEEELEWMSAYPDPIEVQIRQGQTKTKTFIIKNNLDEPLSLEIDYSGVLERFMFINKEDLDIELEPFESREISMEIFAKEDDSPDVYEGQITVLSNQGIYSLNMFIEVKAKEALFDVETTMVDKVISPGQDAVAQIKITDIGDLGRVEADLYYDIRDFENNTLAYANETITINGNATFVRAFNIPENVTKRDYLFYSKVTYEGLIATSADSFIVGDIEGTILLWLIALILLLLILIVIVIIYRNNFYEMWKGIKYKMHTE
ncbi:DUF4215 domain-containing protein [Candidatus Pacearchaeota archaeon]|nr:DUF4215 domain-containing protein [Candidatus Pacearchaeota archaeon]